MSEREAREQAKKALPYTGERWRHARRREFLYAAVAAALALAWAAGTAEQQALNAAAAIDAEARAHVSERVAMHYEALADHYKEQLGFFKAKCMESTLRMTWVDPHTGADMGTFCDTHTLSNGKPR